MKKIITYLREALEISTREAKSTLVFLSVALLSVVLYTLINSLAHSNYANFTVAKFAPDSMIIRPPEAASHFYFDPNTISRDSLLLLGLSPGTARHIVNYRSKGGRFKFREDFRKIYSLSAESYSDLSPWITLPEKPSKAPVKADTLPVKNVAVSLFDINTADTSTLRRIRGIGPAYALRIIRFREALGGFYSLDQLEETYGLPPEVAQRLKLACTLATPVTQIPINEVTAFRHPYLKTYQIKALLAYRDQHGPFATAVELLGVKVLDEETVRKVEPYLRF